MDNQLNPESEKTNEKTTFKKPHQKASNKATAITLLIIVAIVVGIVIIFSGGAGGVLPSASVGLSWLVFYRYSLF